MYYRNGLWSGLSTTSVSRKASGYLIRHLTVLSRDFDVKIKSDFRAQRLSLNQSNLLQIQRISEQLIKSTQ